MHTLNSICLSFYPNCVKKKNAYFCPICLVFFAARCTIWSLSSRSAPRVQVHQTSLLTARRCKNIRFSAGSPASPVSNKNQEKTKALPCQIYKNGVALAIVKMYSSGLVDQNSWRAASCLVFKTS